MLNIKEICKEFVSKTYEERVSLGKELISVVKNSLVESNKSLNDSSNNFIILSILRGFFGADGFLDNKEYGFIKDVFGFDMSYNQILNTFNSEDINLTYYNDLFITNSSIEVRHSLIKLGVLISLIDGNMDRIEKKEIEEINF